MGEDASTRNQPQSFPTLAAWRREAKRRQIRWCDTRSLEPDPKGKGPFWLRGADSAAGKNFVTEEIARTAARRFGWPGSRADEPLEFKRHRTTAHLLASMPMCFNLFGPLAQDQALAKKVIKAWFPDLWIPGADVKVEVKFEYAPRPKREFLDDNTAFDVALIITRDETRHLVGIETKYYERPARETIDDSNRYDEVSRAAGQSRADVARVKETSAVQIWRNHLLALACHQHGCTRVASVLVAPQGNPAWPALANDYLELIPNAADTFEFRTIEQLLGAVPGRLPQEQAFRERYLDVTPI